MKAELQFALEAVRKASIFTKKIQQEKSSEIFIKEDQSPVTIADFGSQLMISHFLQEDLPDDTLVGEENILDLQQEKQTFTESLDHQLSQSIDGFSIDKAIKREIVLRRKQAENRYWVVDPIDGTKGFLRGDQFAIALALMENQTPMLGVIGCPNLDINGKPNYEGQGILAYAVKGQGAWIQEINGRSASSQLFVSNNREASKARFVSSLDISGHSNTDQLLALKSLLNNPIEVAQFDSQAKYVMVASGQFDLFVRLPPASQPNYHEKIWDHAAGELIVEEAGGKVTDAFGSRFDYSAGKTMENNFGVVVSNGQIHEAIIEALKQTQT